MDFNTVAFFIGVVLIPTITVVVFFMRMDWHITRVKDVLKEMNDNQKATNGTVLSTLAKVELRLERLRHRRDDVSEVT